MVEQSLTAKGWAGAKTGKASPPRAQGTPRNTNQYKPKGRKDNAKSGIRRSRWLGHLLTYRFY